MMLQKRILHIFPSENLKNTGVYKYNFYLNKIIKSKFDCKILQENINLIIFKQIYRLFILPFIIIFYVKRKKINTIILPEENILSLSVIKFIININLITIIHDFRSNENIKNSRFFEKIKLIYLKFNYLFVFLNNTIIVPSNQTKLKLKKYKKIQKIKIPNFFEKPKLFLSKKQLFKKYKVLNNKKKILNIATNQSNKNLKSLINFVNKNKKYFLIQIGSKKKEIKNNILYLKNIQQVELNSFLRYSDVYISTSNFEGFGRPPVEARLCNLPVLCLNNKINNEILGDSSFYFENFKKMEKKIIIAIKNKKKNNFIKKYVLNKNTITKTQKLIRSIL